jgi:hypothetical protein
MDYRQVDNGDEWERASDIGGDLAMMDFDEDYELDIARNRRRRNLVGKYVIVCDSANDEGLLYLQDQTISTLFRGHYWTKYLGNARGYEDWTQAKIKCGNLRYNNPRVRYVGKDFSLSIPRYEKGI